MSAGVSDCSSREREAPPGKPVASDRKELHRSKLRLGARWWHPIEVSRGKGMASEKVWRAVDKARMVVVG